MREEERMRGGKADRWRQAGAVEDRSLWFDVVD